MLNISTGVVNRAKRVVIYAVEGIGKTTLASKFPDPLFIDTEGGTAQLDVKRVQCPKTWDEFIEIIEEVAVTPGLCQTLVIDTADWAEKLAIEKVCQKFNLKSMESDTNYGKSYVYLGEIFEKMLASCDKVVDAGMHVVITAHAFTRKFEQPEEMQSYDRWEMKLTKKCAPIIKEWADLLLFLRYNVFAVTNDRTKTNKAQGGKRVMCAAHHPCWDAKNRFGLPDEMPLDYGCISHLFTPPKTSLDELHDLMEKDGVTEEEVRKLVSEKGHYRGDEEISSYTDKFIKGWLIAHWDKVLEAIVNGRKATVEEA